MTDILGRKGDSALVGLRIGCPDIQVYILPPLWSQRQNGPIAQFIGIAGGEVVLQVNSRSFELAAQEFQRAYNEGKYKK